jgi:hypothetical protein
MRGTLPPRPYKGLCHGAEAQKQLYLYRLNVSAIRHRGLMIVKAASMSETSVNFYQTTRREFQKTAIFILMFNTHFHL